MTNSVTYEAVLPCRRETVSFVASTLRWLGELDESLDRARRECPDSDSVRVFRPLTLNDAQRLDEALAELLTVVTGHAEVTDPGRWAVRLRGLAQWLADGRPGSHR